VACRRRHGEHIGNWLESRRRQGFVVGEKGAVNASGEEVIQPEWRLTEAGLRRVRDLSDEQRLVPATVVPALQRNALERLGTAMKTAIAAVPALALAWLVGLIEDPSAAGFAVAAVGFVAVVLLAAARQRAVSRARNPRLREVERIGFTYAKSLQRQADKSLSEGRKELQDAQRQAAAWRRYLDDLDEFPTRGCRQACVEPAARRMGGRGFPLRAGRSRLGLRFENRPRCHDEERTRPRPPALH
jgi:hypothetical protein